MAAPIAAGVLGLMKSVNPCLTPDEAEEILENTADDIESANPGFEGQLGAGRINALEAVKGALGSDGSSSTLPEVSYTFDNSSRCSNIIPFNFFLDSAANACAFSLSYNWNISNGQDFTYTSNQRNPVVEFPASGAYFVRVSVSNPGGTNLQLDTINIETNPFAYIDAGEDQLLCNGDEVQLTATTSANIQSISWAPTEGLSDPNSLTPMFNADRARGVYTLTIEGEDGCTLTDEVLLYVYRNALLKPSPRDTLINRGDSVQLSIRGASAYEWSPPDGLSDPNSARPKASPSETTVYTVQGTYLSGCFSEEEVTVTVKGSTNRDQLLQSLSNISVFPNPANETLQLTAELITSGVLEIGLFDMQGRFVHSVYQGNTFAGPFTHIWQRPATITPGIYSLQWKLAGGQVVQKVVLF